MQKKSSWMKKWAQGPKSSDFGLNFLRFSHSLLCGGRSRGKSRLYLGSFESYDMWLSREKKFCLRTGPHQKLWANQWEQLESFRAFFTMHQSNPGSSLFVNAVLVYQLIITFSLRVIWDIYPYLFLKDKERTKKTTVKETYLPTKTT